MPVVDLPLDVLRTYRGTNPKPDDFDDYWTRALHELDSIDAAIELKAATFQAPFAECFDLYFTGVGGARIHATYLRPTSSSPPHAAIIKFHDYGDGAGEWSHSLGLVGAGNSVAVMDCRGQGGSSEDIGGLAGTTFHGHIVRGLGDDPDRLLFRQIYLDAVQLTRILMSFPNVDERRLRVTGASQGGGLALACAGLEPRVQLVAPVYPLLSDFLRTWEMDLAKTIYVGNRDLSGPYVELATFFRAYDPLHHREAEIFRRLGYIDVQFLAERITSRVLFTIAMRDAVCAPSTQFAAFNRIKGPKELVLYPDHAHEDLPGSDDRIYQFLTRE